MMIEWLKARVPIDLKSRYLQLDAEIWTPVLAQCPGFLGKQVWTSPEDPTEVVLVMQWASRSQWKAIPIDLLRETEQQFVQALGVSVPFVETREYEVARSEAGASDRG